MNGVIVNVGTQATENVKMTVGSTAQTVEVQVVGTELQTLNSTVGQTISAEAISSLPSLNHDANTFTTLQPGVTPDGNVAGAVAIRTCSCWTAATTPATWTATIPSTTTISPLSPAIPLGRHGVTPSLRHSAYALRQRRRNSR